MFQNYLIFLIYVPQRRNLEFWLNFGYNERCGVRRGSFGASRCRACFC